MDYYLYISENKVNMLLPQISEQAVKKLAGELGIQLGILTAKLGTEVENRDALVSRLRVVRTAIEAKGTSRRDGELGGWVKDAMTCRHVGLELAPSLYLLVSKEGQRISLLAGSAANVLSGSNAELVGHGGSYLPYLAEELGRVLAVTEERSDAEVQAKHELSPKRTNWLVSSIDEYELASVIATLWEYSRGIPTRIEILGRKVFSYERGDGITCDVISPIYVMDVTGD